MSPRADQLDAWMMRPDWLRSAARVRAEEAMNHPEHSEERLRQEREAARLECLAWAAEGAARAAHEAAA